MDLGFRGDFVYHGKKYRKHPFDILAAYDNEEHCVESYNDFFGGRAYVQDLSKCDMSKIPAADVLIGGFPCQDFSLCGPLRGLNSDRGQLYQAMINYAVEHQPKVIVGENVANLSRMEEGKVIDTIIADFKAAGYKFKVWNINAADYGVPQNRERIILVGVPDSAEKFPRKPNARYKKQHNSIKWAIGDLENITDDSVPNQNQYFKANKAKKGNGQGDETSIADMPSYTMRANAKSRIQFHYNKERRLTIRECARVQTFPDSYVFSHAMTTSMSEIGNAVPPVLAYKIATSINNYLERYYNDQ